MWAARAGREIVESRPEAVSDTGELEKIIDDLIAANPDRAAAVCKPQAIAGSSAVMKATGGKANWGPSPAPEGEAGDLAAL